MCELLNFCGLENLEGEEEPIVGMVKQIKKFWDFEINFTNEGEFHTVCHCGKPVRITKRGETFTCDCGCWWSLKADGNLRFWYGSECLINLYLQSKGLTSKKPKLHFRICGVLETESSKTGWLDDFVDWLESCEEVFGGYILDDEDVADDDNKETWAIIKTLKIEDGEDEVFGYETVVTGISHTQAGCLINHLCNLDSQHHYQLLRCYEKL